MKRKSADWKEWAVRRIEHRLAVACGQCRRTEARMLLDIASDINDHVIHDLAGGPQLRDKYLKLRDQFTGEYVLAPYIWVDLGRRESNGELANSTEHKKLIAESLKEVNEQFCPFKVEDSEWWTGNEGNGPSQSIRALSVGGALEVDIAARYYKARPKPKTWDEELGRRSLRGRHYLRGGTSGRVRPNGDMTCINQLMLKLNHRQRVVYQGMVLTEPALSRAEIARKLGIRHLNQVSQILKRAQAKMNKWLSRIEQKTR